MDIFGLINSKIAEAEVKQLTKEHGGERKTIGKPISVDTLPASACCGSCANISYHGIMEVKLEYGDCEAYQHSQRFVTTPSSKPCEFFRPRSRLKMINERTYADQVCSELSGLNATIRGGARTLDAVKIGKVKRPKELDEDKPKKRSASEALTFLGIGLLTEDEQEDCVESGQLDEDLDVIQEGEL